MYIYIHVYTYIYILYTYYIIYILCIYLWVFLSIMGDPKNHRFQYCNDLDDLRVPLWRRKPPYPLPWVREDFLPERWECSETATTQFCVRDLRCLVVYSTHMWYNWGLVLFSISIGFTTLFIFVVHSVVIDPLLKDMPWLEEVSKFDPCPLCCIWAEVICLSQGCGTTAVVTRFFETPVPTDCQMDGTNLWWFLQYVQYVHMKNLWFLHMTHVLDWFANTTWHCLACFRIFHYLYPSILFVPFDGYSIIWLTSIVHMFFIFDPVPHRIGWWENLQESPIFDGKNHGFL